MKPHVDNPLGEIVLRPISQGIYGNDPFILPGVKPLVMYNPHQYCSGQVFGITVVARPLVKVHGSGFYHVISLTIS